MMAMIIRLSYKRQHVFPKSIYMRKLLLALGLLTAYSLNAQKDMTGIEKCPFHASLEEPETRHRRSRQFGLVAQQTKSECPSAKLKSIRPDGSGFNYQTSL
jgi:hypothetical protein